MASDGRRTTDPVAQPALEELLEKEPWAFDFFQAIRLLILLQPEREPIGDFALPQQEAVRIGSHASLAFPAGEIQTLHWPEEGAARMSVNFFGLVGPLGVLPTPYTELVAERRRQRDRTMGEFFDLFHHRMASLFYRAWEKSHFTVGFERELTEPLTESLYALLGLGSPGLRNRQAIADESFLFYGGLFGMRTRPAGGLEAIISDYFDVPVKIRQFVGVWRQLDECDFSYLETGPAENYQLGGGVVLGDEVWDQQSRARIQIGPLTVERYLDFLPDGLAFEPLRTLTKAYCGGDIEFELELILKRSEAPKCCLGKEDAAGPRLGWLSWINSKPEMDRDPGDTVLLL